MSQNEPDPDEEPQEAPDMSKWDIVEDVTPYIEFQIRPSLAEKFHTQVVKELIHTILDEELSGKSYSATEASGWCMKIAGLIRNKVKELDMKKYKLVVQVVIGEQHGAGVKVGARCLWDADSDASVSNTFMSETIFCMAVVFAVYFY